MNIGKDFVNFNLPCTRLVRNYVAYQYRHEEEIIVHQNNIVGRELYKIFTNPNNFKCNGFAVKDETILPLKLTVRSLQHIKCTNIKRETINYFNETMYKWLMKDFIDYMEDNIGREKKVVLMEEFRAKYSLTEEDLSIDTLWKNDFRKITNARYSINTHIEKFSRFASNNL